MQESAAAQAVGAEFLYAQNVPSVFFDALQNANLSESLERALAFPIVMFVQAATGALQFVVEEAAI